jgi:predicted transcriptional regulator
MRKWYVNTLIILHLKYQLFARQANYMTKIGKGEYRVTKGGELWLLQDNSTSEYLNFNKLKKRYVIVVDRLYV